MKRNKRLFLNVTEITSSAIKILVFQFINWLKILVNIKKIAVVDSFSAKVIVCRENLTRK